MIVGYPSSHIEIIILIVKKCLCEKDYDVTEDFGMNFIRGKIYEYSVVYSVNLYDHYMLIEPCERLSSGYSTLPFNEIGFKEYFIDLKEVRKEKLKKIWQS